MSPLPSTPPSSERGSLRGNVFFDALSAAIKLKSDDSELLLALGKLWLAESPDGSPSDFFSQAITARRGNPGPPLGDFVFWCAQVDGFGCGSAAIAAVLASCLAAPSYSQGSALLAAERSVLALSGSPWARSMGMLLNEARPDDAPLWPLFSALGPIEAKELASIARLAAPLGPQHAKARDDFLELACQTGHAPLFALALKALPAIAPSSTCLSNCCSALARGHPHAGARRALGFKDEPAIDSPAMALLVADAFATPSLDQQLLLSVCLSEMRFPAALVDTPWKATAASLASRGTRELDLDGLLGMARSAQAQGAELTARPAHGFGARSTRVARREMDSAAFDELAAACVKNALLPRSLAVGPDRPPLAFLLMDILADAGPKARDVIIKAMDRWAREGFGKDALAWRRAASGQTQSVGSAIAGLPKTQDPSNGSSAHMSAWLVALAGQGFDFEAKATPKSKSLGEKLRSSPSLKEFWPLVESRMLAATTPADAPSRRRSPL